MEFTKESFKATFPALFEEIQKEAFEKGVSQGLKDGSLSGAESERARIKSVEEQLIPGHEALIATLKFDGKTTGPEAAVQVLQKEKELMKTRHEDLVTDGQKTKVKDPALGAGDAAGKDASEKLEALVREAMEKDPKLSYTDALLKVQKENVDLARQVLAQMDAKRVKNNTRE